MGKIDKEVLESMFCVIKEKVTTGNANNSLTEIIPKGKGICVIALDTIGLEDKPFKEMREEVLSRFIKRLSL